MTTNVPNPIYTIPATIGADVDPATGQSVPGRHHATKLLYFGPEGMSWEDAQAKLHKTRGEGDPAANNPQQLRTTQGQPEAPMQAGRFQTSEHLT